jgi:hypothetical protein
VGAEAVKAHEDVERVGCGHDVLLEDGYRAGSGATGLIGRRAIGSSLIRLLQSVGVS